MYTSKKISFSKLIFYLALLVFCGLIFIKPILPNPQFKLDNGLVNQDSNTRIFESFIIPEPEFLITSHSATFTILPNNNLKAMWFAGSHEGKPDVKIWQSEFNGESWSRATDILSPEILGANTKRFIKKVGNPVVYRAENGILHLFVVSVSIGGWSGSSLNHFTSSDDGLTWQYKDKLILSPFFNFSTLDRTIPITLADGGFYLPVYHEFIHAYPELLRFDANGNFINQIRMTSKIHLLQPSIVSINSDKAYSFLRNSGQIDDVLYMQKTNNGGLKWSNPESTNIKNHDSSIATVNLGSLGILMVHNPSGRNQLVLSISKDAKTWRQFYVLESSENGEFSYPVVKVHDHLVDILYTWNRKGIKHVRFNKLWLDSQLNRQSKSWNI